jgi:hypothetical protein
MAPVQVGELIEAPISARDYIDQKITVEESI